MVLRFSKGMWLVSILGVMATLLYAYASLPEQVFLYQEDLKMVTVSKEILFYIFLAGLAIVNVLVFVVSAAYKNAENLRSWFNGLVVTLNIFFVVVLFFLNSSNSNEKFDYTRIGFLIYGSIILVVLWAVSWPVFLFFRKFLSKSQI
jgi:membrane-associated HD superfamily phosphohydrolase